MAVSSWSLIVALCCSLLASIVCGQHVAPGDEDPFCFDSPFRVPVPPKQKILLDTQNYKEKTLIDTNGATVRWVSGNFDGLVTDGANYNWRDNAQTFVCVHQLLACDPDNQPQDNWLITQFINITDDNVEQLVVSMTFSSALECPTCQQSFSMQAYETNILDETGRVNQSFYQDTGTRFFHRQDNEELESAVDSFTITSKGLYLAVVDTGSCTRITRLYVFYYVCPTQVVNMIQYPETVSPPTTNPQDRTAMGTCIDNASPIDGAILELDCSINGNWEINDLGCSCDPGYEMIMDSCEACAEGEYKLVQGNEGCVECPVNSNSSLPGATSCDCTPGYYRTTSENATVQCTAPPTAPNNISAPVVNPTSVYITWAPPTDNGGRNDLFYTVAYSNGTFTSTPVNVANNTQYTITDLTPSNQYIITVTTNNGVSNQDPNIADRTATINVITPPRGPTPPLGVALSSDNDLILQWSPPTFLYGTLTRYDILVASVDNPSEATVRDTTTETSYDLTRLDINAGVYFIFVRAVTDNGLGELSTSVRHVEVDEGSTALVAGAVGGVVFLLLLAILIAAVLIIVIFLYRSKKDKYVPSSTNNIGHHPELELGVLPITDEDSSNRMYVDPRNYSSLNHAFDETGVKEIPPKEIINLDEIGVGEFGLVYKATWTLKNVKVAVKTLRGGANEEQKRNFLFEASVMAQFKHPNVVKLYGSISRIDPIMIIMEYMDNGSLDRYLQKHLDKLGSQRQLKISCDVAVGMSYLSKIGFVHRDLAARNILVATDETAKVADFGLAREMVENEYGVQRGGRIPVRWTAPEAISHRSFTTASDVWSFGVLLWEIMTYGETPYGEWDNYAVFDRLEQGERLKQPKYCPDDVYQLMLLCWEKERSERPTFDSICDGLEIMIHGKPKPKPKPAHLKGTSLSPPPSSPTQRSQPIEDFLKSIQMGKYIELFQQSKLLTVEDCYKLDEDDLEKMGVTLGGHQHKIIKNIKIRQEELGTSY